MTGLLTLIQDALTSPWVYAALFSLAALDAMLPFLPSETAILTTSVFAATGNPDLLAVIVTSALGATIGDHCSYLIGRRGGERFRSWTPQGKRPTAALSHAKALLADRASLILILARYIPGGRTAITVTAGLLAYPLRRYTPLVALAATSWATYYGLLGYLGGSAFQQSPVRAVLLGVALAVCAVGTVEVVRRMSRNGLRAH